MQIHWGLTGNFKNVKCTPTFMKIHHLRLAIVCVKYKLCFESGTEKERRWKTREESSLFFFLPPYVCITVRTVCVFASDSSLCYELWKVYLYKYIYLFTYNIFCIPVTFNVLKKLKICECGRHWCYKQNAHIHRQSTISYIKLPLCVKSECDLLCKHCVTQGCDPDWKWEWRHGTLIFENCAVEESQPQTAHQDWCHTQTKHRQIHTQKHTHTWIYTYTPYINTEHTNMHMYTQYIIHQIISQKLSNLLCESWLSSAVLARCDSVLWPQLKVRPCYFPKLCSYPNHSQCLAPRDRDTDTLRQTDTQINRHTHTHTHTNRNTPSWVQSVTKTWVRLMGNPHWGNMITVSSDNRNILIWMPFNNATRESHGSILWNCLF